MPLRLALLLALTSCASGSLLKDGSRPPINVYSIGDDQSICKDHEAKTDCLSVEEASGMIVISPILFEFIMSDLDGCKQTGWAGADAP